MKKYEIYLKASAAILEFGHCHGRFKDDEGRMCLGGAINYATHGDALESWHDDAETLIKEVTPIVIDETADTSLIWSKDRFSVTWNNLDTTKQSDVVAVLDAAAVLAMQEAGLEPEDVLQ